MCLILSILMALLAFSYYEEGAWEMVLFYGSISGGFFIWILRNLLRAKKSH